MINKGVIQSATLASVAMVTSAPLLEAVVMRSDVLEQEYIDLAKPYNSVGRAIGVGLGTGFLVSPTKFVTAGHVVDDDQNGVVDPGINYRVRFSMTGSGFDDTYTPSSVDVFQRYKDSSGYDIAVYTFSTPITAYTPIPISIEDPFGKLATMVGYGLSGVGDGSFAIDATRRAAQNIIDGQDSRFYLTDFDSPFANTSSYGTATPVALEGTSASGDSGGPLIVDGAVIGIVQGGYANPYGGASQYGDRATWVRLNDPEILDYLQNDHGITVVPEPSVFALGLAGLFLLNLRRPSRT